MTLKQMLKRYLDTPLVGTAIKKMVASQVNKEATQISEHFSSYLSPHVTTRNPLRQEAFRIRHDVYCSELNFEEQRPDQMESDEFDEHAIFSLIEHRNSGNFTGCIRVVESSNEDEQLPLEKYCDHAFTSAQLSPSNFRRDQLCEFSRLAVRAAYRRRKMDQYPSAATGAINEITYSEKELRCFPFIAIGLYMSAAAIAIERGTHHAFVMMEPRLARSMRFVGINFKQVGPTIEYHGKRAPYYISAERFLESLKPGFRNLYDQLGGQVKPQLAAMEQSGELTPRLTKHKKHSLFNYMQSNRLTDLQLQPFTTSSTPTHSSHMLQHQRRTPKF